MTVWRNNVRLDLVAAALRDDPTFLAGWLAASESNEERLAAQLGLDDQGFARLLLCRVPQARSFIHDVRAIADYVHVDSNTLAVMLREVAAVSALRHVEDSARIG